MSAFTKLCGGLTATFTSVTASISSNPAVDLDLTWTQNGVTYQAAMEDCELDTLDMSDGSPLTEAFSFTVLGPVTIESETWIASR